MTIKTSMKGILFSLKSVLVISKVVYLLKNLHRITHLNPHTIRNILKSKIFGIRLKINIVVRFKPHEKSLSFVLLECSKMMSKPFLFLSKLSRIYLLTTQTYRTKSNQRWMKLRTTVQISSAIAPKKPTLKREDSFLKRFSTRQIPETQVGLYDSLVFHSVE